MRATDNSATSVGPPVPDRTLQPHLIDYYWLIAEDF